MKMQKEQELEQQRIKYEKIIDEMKRNSLNDRDFIQKELQRKIDDLEKQLRELREQFDLEREKLIKEREDMKADYERRIADLKSNLEGDSKKTREDFER